MGPPTQRTQTRACNLEVQNSAGKWTMAVSEAKKEQKRVKYTLGARCLHGCRNLNQCCLKSQFFTVSMKTKKHFCYTHLVSPQNYTRTLCLAALSNFRSSEQLPFHFAFTSSSNILKAFSCGLRTCSFRLDPLSKKFAHKCLHAAHRQRCLV